MSPKANNDLEKAVGHVMQRIGQSLVMYQRIELYLKYLLPHVVTDDEPPTDTMAQWRSLLDSKTTLGPLIARLRESVRTTDPRGLDHYLGELVEHRNELIHHFCRLPVGRLRNVEECNAALAHLDTRLQFALPLFEMLHAGVEQFYDQLLDLKRQGNVDGE